jgi:hypothetical protein
MFSLPAHGHGRGGRVKFFARSFRPPRHADGRGQFEKTARREAASPARRPRGRSRRTSIRPLQRETQSAAATLQALDDDGSPTVDTPLGADHGDAPTVERMDRQRHGHEVRGQ